MLEHCIFQFVTERHSYRNHFNDKFIRALYRKGLFMWGSKDLGLVTVLAALGFVTAASILQMGYVFTGIRGLNYIFIIFLAIQTGFALLVYEGRRWRFFVQMTVFTLLIIPTNLGGPAFDILGKTSYMIAGFFTDLIANSFYPYFKKRKKSGYWSVFSGGLLYWALQATTGIMLTIAFYAPIAEAYVSLVVLLSPVIMAEAVVGSYLGYKIHRRIDKDNKIEKT